MRREEAPIGENDLGDRELDGDDAAILAARFHLHPPAEHVRLAGRAVAGQPVLMCSLEMVRHDQVAYRPADRLLFAVAEGRHGSAVQRYDEALLVDHDDGIERRGDHGGVDGSVFLQRPQGFRDPLFPAPAFHCHPRGGT